MAYISPMLTNVVTAVKKASVHLNRDFSEIERLQNSIKGSLGFSRIAYEKIQKCLKLELNKFFPTIPVVLIGEKTPNSGMFFNVSAVEGVANFGHGNPHFAISVALLDGDVILAGVVYNPARDELFFAEKGKGAYKEGFRSHERLRVSSKQELEGSLVAIKPDVNDTQLSAKLVNNTIDLTKDVRVSGALALDLAYVAAGKLDCVIAPRSMPQSICAGILLVKESGGMILDMQQSDTRSENVSAVLNSGDLVAVNFNLSQKIANILK
jgi:myo-inositol-1(or 4)-monophosphatase